MESELAAADDDEEDEAQDGDAQKAGEEATDEAGSFDREQAMSQILAALATREGLRTTNLALQHKLAEMFRKRRAEDKSAEIDKSGTDQDQRYGNIMTNLQQLHDEFNSMEKWNMQQETDYKTRLHDKREDLRKKSEEFRRYKRQTALTAENSRTGKPIPTKLVEQMEQLELKKEQDVAAVRLENIKLRNKLKRHEQTLRQKEELAEGLHLIDFEQLKIENQTYNEKIEERNEELMKLRKKITNVVQVLAHIKEKLQFVQQEHKALSSELSAVDAQVTVQRDSLPLAKQRRDTLRNRNVYIKEKNGLLGNDALLRDYELRVVRANLPFLHFLQCVFNQLYIVVPRIPSPSSDAS
ncbi:hypothetical protein BC828DRAFT_343699 [Blastocladiella britannica]|nr:hypothetical protein BC828DRAFT_343699 [Blastocladiella britannica]